MVSNYRVSVILGDTGKGTAQLIASGARPPVVKVHNNIGHAQLLHNHLGDDTLIIIRMTGPESIVNRAKPAAQNAVEWCAALEPAFRLAPWAYWEAGPPLQPCDEWYADFQIAAMNWMYARNYRATVMTIGEGNPGLPSAGEDGMAAMWPVVQLAASYGYLLGPQAYWVDGRMDPADDWHMFRIYRAFRDYPGKWPAGTRIVFSECGIDLRNGLGWRTALNGSWPRYRAGLKLMSEEIKRRPCPPGVTVVGGTVFAIHEVDNDWRDFNYLEHLSDQLEDIKAEQGIVEMPPAPIPLPDEEPISGEYVVDYCKALRVRTGPSTESTILTALPAGTKVVVRKTVNGWGQIEPVVENWMSLDYLRRKT